MKTNKIKEGEFGYAKSCREYLNHEDLPIDNTQISISELISDLKILQDRYGSHAELYISAGHNNIEVDIIY